MIFLMWLIALAIWGIGAGIYTNQFFMHGTNLLNALLCWSGWGLSFYYAFMERP